MSDGERLKEMMANGAAYSAIGHPVSGQGMACDEPPAAESEPPNVSMTQWTSGDGRVFIPAPDTARVLPPGLYEIGANPQTGTYFEKLPVVTSGILRFPQTNFERVTAEITKFWDRRAVFDEYGILHRRGIFLFGPPGSGKTSLIQLVMEDVIRRGGVAVKFGHPHLFTDGMRKFRQIQPETPVVILMEDLDSTVQQYPETEVLNILDGVDRLDRVVYLASSNYPERLGDRVVNRPSRFDKRFFIGHPNPESRRMYLEHLIGTAGIESLGIELGQWVADTDGFSLAHLKELFTAVVILGDPYDDAVETLRDMKEVAITSEDDDKEFRTQLGYVAGRSGPKRRR